MTILKTLRIDAAAQDKNGDLIVQYTDEPKDVSAAGTAFVLKPELTMQDYLAAALGGLPAERLVMLAIADDMASRSDPDDLSGLRGKTVTVSYDPVNRVQVTFG